MTNNSGNLVDLRRRGSPRRPDLCNDLYPLPDPALGSPASFLPGTGQPSHGGRHPVARSRLAYLFRKPGPGRANEVKRARNQQHIVLPLLDRREPLSKGN